MAIHTLGGLTVRRNGTPIEDFDQRKVPALLVYLACTDRPQPREALAELFWSGRTQSQALSNLRVALSNLRKTVGPFVEITRETVGMQPDSKWWLDAVAFERSMTDASLDHTGLEAVVDLYQGDFLEGFYIDSQGFEDWVRLERERLHFRGLEALDRLIDRDLAAQDYASGITQATRLLRLDPLREATYRHLMRLFALSGERTTALTYYETCRQMLETEFGVQPAAETVSLYERIQAGERPAGATATVAPGWQDTLTDTSWQRPRHNLPPQPTSFVGRESEIAAITEQLNISDCRLLTLVGPGGIGKTRLALAVAETMLDEFADGVHFVPLTAVDSPGRIAPAISRVLGLESSHRDSDAEKELLNFLHNREMLLVLDNFEHLVAGGDLLSRILAAASGVKVLTTSREPLELSWEYLIEIRGLNYPKAPDDGQTEDYNALQLFVERARRANPDFRLAPVRDSVVRICQRVDGMPLGIEIAAAWVRGLPCETIADELLALELPHRNAPDRHRSLRTLFDYIWRQLPPHEQNIFMALSIFRGSFTADAAEVVTGASAVQLASLVNKSLVQRSGEDSRYSIHELLRQYAETLLRAAPEEEYAACQRHSGYYCAFLNEQYGAIINGMCKAVVDELDNVLAAWNWAVSNAKLGLIEKGLHSLYWFLERRQTSMLGNQVFHPHASALLQSLPYRLERDAVLAQLMAVETFYCFDSDRQRVLAEGSLTLARTSGNQHAQAFTEMIAASGFTPDEAVIHLRQSIALYTALDDKWGVAQSTMLLGSCNYRHHMRLAEGLSEAQTALALFRELQNQQGILDSLLLVAAILSSQYEFEGSQQCYHETLALLDEFDCPNLRAKAKILNNLAYLHTMSCIDLAEAEELASQAVALQRDYGGPHEVWIALDTLATVKYVRGDYSGAGASFGECFEILQCQAEAGPGQFAVTYAKLGLIAQCTGCMQEAYQQLSKSLQVALDHNLPTLIVETMVFVALTWAHDGRPARALDLLGFTIPRPAWNKHVLDEASLRAEMKMKFGPDAVQAAIDRAKDIDPLELAREVLADLEQP